MTTNFITTIIFTGFEDYSKLIINALSFLTAFVITWFAIPSIIKVANVKHLFDEPGARKSHNSRIPTLGGLAIFAGVIFSFTFWSAEIHFQYIRYILASIIVLFFVGIKDDLFPLSSGKKLLGQVFSAIIIVYFADFRIENMHGILGVNSIPYWPSLVLSLFTIIVITNAYNLIDGIDGLAAGIGIIASFIFGVFFYFIDAYFVLSILAFTLTGSLIAFIRYNFQPAKIFMGDTGSLIIGLILSVLAISFIENGNEIIPYFGSLSAAPVISICILIIPLFDTLRVFFIRMLKRQSPFRPDKKHIHHILIQIGFTHRRASITLYLTNILFIILAFCLKDLEINTMMIILFVFALLLSQIPFVVKNYIKYKRVKALNNKSA
jgi:UDP-GlcNAc:undecaprenyl-phosphate GlcNAc-1-phosphate transferase